jgi:hypothetical protein
MLPDPLEKGKIKKGIIPFNVDGSRDFLTINKEIIAEKNLVIAREQDLERKDRENYFLRTRLKESLDEIENQNILSDNNYRSDDNGAITHRHASRQWRRTMHQYVSLLNKE